MGGILWFTMAVLSSLCGAYAYNILVLFPMPGKSHGILGDGVVRLLLKAGHEVTYITPYVSNNPDPKLRQIDVSENAMVIPEKLLNLQSIMEDKIDCTDRSMVLLVTNKLAHTTIKNENVQKLLQDPKEKFDLVLSEWIFSDLYAGLAAVYNCPLIWLSTLNPHWMVLRIIDEGLNPAYNSDIFTSNVPPFGFTQRVQELWVQIKTSYHINQIDYKEKEDFDTYLVPIIEQRGRTAPLYEDVKHNASLMLGNSHVSMGAATRLPQSYKPIGGYHIEETVKPLPEDLKKLMDNAKAGVIYFSMGSNLKSKDLPIEIKTGLLKVFGSLKQTVLWKFEEVLPDLPENVHILKWAPQPSILSHPNCILFITHGGLLSTTETIHFGVPIIGIPVFADQFNNVHSAVNRGFAMMVNLSYKMAEDLKMAIEEIIQNSRYRERVKELSFIYHDRPVSPGAELVHWVEHVVKTRGAPHLRSPALLVPWYQKMYLDLLAIVLISLIVLSIALKRVCSLWRSNNDTNKKTN